VAGLAATFGSGAMTNSIKELENSRCIFIIGSNTTEQHPLIARYILRAKERGACLIVADPRRIQLTRFADFHLRQRPGTDIALLNGLMNVILSEGLEDKEFIRDRTEGIEDLRAAVKEYTPEYVEQVTGVPAETLVKAARAMAGAESAAVLYSMGITQHTTGVDNVRSCANLAMLTGNLGKPGTGVNPLRGQNNVQGACDMGALPNVFTGYQNVADESLRKKFEEAWQTALPAKPGFTITDMIQAASEGKIKALYIMGENPLVSDPDIEHLKESLEKVDFLVVQDIFLTETAKMADVVLPGASYAEKDGTFTSTERSVQMVRKAVQPPGEAHSDFEIICGLARLMGAGGFDYASPAQVMDEIASLTPSYGGISHERLANGGLQWPCPGKDHPGTPYLYKEKFSRPNGKGKFFGVESKESAELPDVEYPFVLTTGRSAFHYHTGTMTRKTALLDREVSTGYVEINTRDAEKMGIREGDTLRVKSRRGEIQIQARVADQVSAGVIFIPFHFAECAANLLTNSACDPVSKIPEYKVCAVKVEKLAPVPLD
jgi:formate dehydrogenase alpha subunit